VTPFPVNRDAESSERSARSATIRTIGRFGTSKEFTVLVGRHHSPRRRIGNVLALTAIAAAPAVGWWVGATAGWWDWPSVSSSAGVLLGFAAGFIVLFEMLLWPRKWFRGTRLGATRAWMRLHVWIGLLSLPVVVIHSGFALGGSLSALTMILFLVVIASGVWGLALQQWLPQKLLADVSSETVAGLTTHAMHQYAEECKQRVLGLMAGDGVGDEKGSHGVTAAATLSPATAGVYDALATFQAERLGPYLEGGRRSGSPLAARGEVDRQFARLRASLPAPAHSVLDRMKELTDLRRQWDDQLRITWWLHNWLLVHLPASVAMTAFMLVHAVVALKYW
jgi:hypothetical protein